LYQLILQHRNPQRPQFPGAFGDVLPSHQSGVVALLFEPPFQLAEIGFEVLFILLKGHSIDARGCVFAQLVEAVPEAVHSEQPIQAAESVVRLLRGFGGYGPQGGSPA